ncbi:alpha/beta-hydrolase [Aspergillus ellipticus CBS 707.79]|uniref:Alpha/beta-hydrolase n=1 Tax=Aspergillus ellipticus CBS 707.79 TaxID=1448320 RepID=A0A319CW89_9EURO|nr:alpha/beta-hydrolase [Aspergillus ellipticus CBS 707.79]
MPPYIIQKPLITTLRLLARLTHPIPPPDPTTTETISIPSRDPSRTIKAHLYNPPTTNPRTPTPILLNLSGTGFTIPSHGIDAPFATYLTTHTPYSLLDLSYRLAPEHPFPFPAALQDAHDALAYILSQPNRFDTSRIALCGFSAGGGGLAASLAANPDLLPQGMKVHALVAFYPVVDATVPAGEKMPEVDLGRRMLGGSIPAGVMRFSQGCYLRGDGGGVGRCLFVVCQGDSLAGETERLVGRLRGGDGDGDGDGERVVRAVKVMGVGHAWDKIARAGSWEAQERDRAYAAVVELLNE